MSKTEIAKDLIKKIFPYLLIVAAVFLSTIVYFNNGIMSGDDIAFHLSMTNDVLYGLKHGYWTISANHLHMGGFALNNYGFYGPLTHYGAAIFTFLFEWAGATPSTGLKAVVFLSAALGGVYTYFFAMKVSKQNRIVSTIASVLFVFLPYRIFCALCRCAFAESVAICFIPVVFFACYSIAHDEKYSVHPYVALCVGGIGIILAHPFTGLLTALFALVYLVFNIKNLIKKREGFSIWPSLGISALICCLGVFFYVGNAFLYKSTGLYNLCDPVKMWTTYEHVSASTANSNDFSGFLNLIVINGWQGSSIWNNETVSSITFSIFVYFVSMVLCVVSDTLCRLLPKNKYYRYFIDAGVTIILPLITKTRQEVWISIAISFLIFLFITFIFDYSKPKEEEKQKKLIYNPDFYFSIFALVVCFVFMYVPQAWKIVPPIMYQAQFAWRIWGITTFFIVMLVTLLLSQVKAKKNALIAGSIIVSSLCALSMGPIEKRVAYEVRQDKLITEDGEEYAKSIKFSGAQNEMIPQVFYDETYRPENEKSLYYSVRYCIWYWRNYCYDIDSYIPPSILDGSGTIEITEYNSPENTFHFNITSETALVQFPQFYYSGYKAIVDGKEYSSAQNVDGLVALELPKGEHTLKLQFIESNFVKVGMPLFYVAVSLMVAGGVFGVYYSKKIIPAKLKKKEEMEQSNK